MKIKGKLIFRFTSNSEDSGRLVKIISGSLSPDNLCNMETCYDENSITVAFSADKVGTILSSVDDYLMNAIIVQKLSYIFRRKGL